MPEAPTFVFMAPRSSKAPPSLCDAWRAAIQTYFGEEGNTRFDVQEGKLHDLDPALLQCDCMVSPANSFGIMDGGYDYDLSRAFMGETKDMMRLTRHVQGYLRTTWGGYAPPSSCTIVPLPSDVSGARKNPWSARTLAVLPTMRVPQEVSWNKDLVYNCMWTLLCQISLWNRDRKEGEHIHRVLMTGLGTGCGNVAAEVCAKQMVLAVKHWTQDLPHEPEWGDVLPRAKQIEATFATSGLQSPEN